MGFKPETMAKKILPALGYDGPMDSKSIQAFLAASPAAAAKMGKYTMAARRMIEQPVNAADGISLNPFKGFGTPEFAAKSKASHDAAVERQRINKVLRDGSFADRVKLSKQYPGQVSTQELVRGRRGGEGSNNSNRNPAPAPVQQAPVYTQQAPVYSTSPGTAGANYTAGPSFSQMLNTSTGGSGNVAVNPATGVPTITGSGVNEGLPKGSELTRQIMDDPTKPVTVANVVSDDGGEAALIPLGTGQAGETREAVPLEFADPAQAAQVTAPDQIAQIDPAMSADAVAADMQARQAAEGQVNEQAQIAAEQIDPTAGSALGLEAAQLDEAQQVEPVARLLATPDQLVDGPTVDRQQVASTFGTGPVQAATVKGELAELMQDFEVYGNTPPWAAGAIRAANAAMAARGLSITSMAGMAITQAAMEAALPIAQMDAANKQEMALMKAEQRARFMNMEFDQAFQAKVINAARISEIANLNFSAEQQVALENARIAQTVDLSNLSNRQAKVMADAATMSQMDMANLDNRQQAAVLNAQSFLQMDLSNLDNNQQMTMFKAQEAVNSILSDTAAMNAARQFNASSQNQSDQFFANLGSQVNQFNAEQLNAMERFNAGEANALSQFNAQQENARDQFNAQNHLIIAQANAQWAQAIATAANAAANQANRDAALAANNLTMTAYNNVIQRERDLLAWAWASADNAKERDKAIAVATIAADGDGAGLVETAAGSFLGKVTSRAVDLIFPAPF